MLPKTSKVEGVELGSMCFFFYGPPGIGKSKLVEGFVDGKKKPLYMWTSPVKFCDGYKMPIDSWETFKKAVRELDEERPNRYSAIALDIVDFIWMHCRAEICDRHGIEHEGDMAHGKGWDLVKREWISTIAKLATLGYPLIFISHAKVVEQRGRAITTKKLIPTLQGGCHSATIPLCDVEGFIGFDAEDADADTGERRIFFQPTEVIEAKDWTERLPVSMKSHRDPKRTVDAIKAALAGPKREDDNGAAAPKKRKIVRRKAKGRRRTFRRRA